MSQDIYLEVIANSGHPSEFHIYLPAGGEFYGKYRFIYEVNAPDPSLGYGDGPNNPANRNFWRIRTAHIVKKAVEGFVPLFRALSDGEIGFALLEDNAGDFVGGFHGDEVTTDVKLTVNGAELPLDKPFFGKIDGFSFFERSTIFRCNTPDTPILLHTQNYTVSGGKLCLMQEFKWLTDAKKIESAFMPMLTAQRLNADNPDEILTDTVEFYGDDGTLIVGFDTSDRTADKIGSPNESVCRGTNAASVKVYGKNSGFSAEAGYTVLDNTIPQEKASASLCIRHMRNAVDNKIYFDIAGGTEPKRGDIWKSDVFYRLTFTPNKITDTKGGK